MDNTYQIELHCHNCHDAREYIIEKGMRVPSVPCENCGIKSLKPVAWIDRKKPDEDDFDD